MTEPKKRKILVVQRGADGKVISGNCSGCGRLFKFEDTPDGRSQVEQAFETHECKRLDDSQNAVRIVREATENH